MKLVVSIGVICSLVLSCSPKNAKTPLINAFRIGVQTQLLSVDHLSVNSLGEKRVIDLINPRLIYLNESQELKSKYGSIEFNGYILTSKNSLLKEEIRKSFVEVKESSLWGHQFNEFLFNKDKGIVCKLEKSCLEKFLTLVSVLRSKKYAVYKVKRFLKGREIYLSKKEKKIDFPDNIKIRRFKKVEDGVNFLRQNKIDLFYPHEKVVKRKNSELVYVEKNGRYLRLSLYYKYGDKISKAFYKSLCASMSSLKSSFTDWGISKNICQDKRNIIFDESKQIKAVGDSKLTNKFFDIVYQNKPKDFLLSYEVLSPYNLTKSLKLGAFDLYMSEEIYDESYPVLFEAFHSQGSFNTLNYNNKKLDQVLNKNLHAQNFKDFFKVQKNAKKMLNEIEPVLIRFKRKSYSRVFRKSDENSKTLKAITQYLE